MTLTAAPGWELASLATEPILAAPQLIRRPRVEVQGDRLVWWITNDRDLGQQVAAPADLLLKFSRLATVKPARIREFAAEWGLLCICEHGVPASHNPPPPFLGGYNGIEYWCSWLGWHDRPREVDGWEPLAAWAEFAGKAHAILNLAAALHVGRRGTSRTGGRYTRSRVT